MVARLCFIQLFHSFFVLRASGYCFFGYSCNNNEKARLRASIIYLYEVIGQGRDTAHAYRTSGNFSISVYLKI